MNVRDEEYVRPKRRNIPTTWDDKPVGRNAKKPRYKDHRRGKRNKRDAD